MTLYLYCLLYLFITHNGAGSALDIFCSRDIYCYNMFDVDSVRECCVQEGILRHMIEGDELCQLCYGMLNITCKKCRFVIFCAL